jgi:hypothetical protein
MFERPALKDQLPIENLFIFGAGASYAVTKNKSKKPENIAPLDERFCSYISNLSSSEEE